MSAESRRCASAIASASPTSTCRTSASCRRCCPASSPTPRRARAQAGFDGVELHYAHAYTMASFLSALNTRDDGYGGTRENRVRLPLEVIRAVRGAVGERFVVGCRYLGDECIAGGNRVDDAAWFGVEFARAGLDFLSLSRGRQVRGRQAAEGRLGRVSLHRPERLRVHADGLLRRARPVRPQRPPRRVRAAVRAAGFRTPIVTSGGISTSSRPRAPPRGEADIVASARQSLADPDWFRKMRLGRGQRVRRCDFTNYCEALDQQHKQVTCKLWDPLRPRAADGRARRGSRPADEA